MIVKSLGKASRNRLFCLAFAGSLLLTLPGQAAILYQQTFGNVGPGNGQVSAVGWSLYATSSAVDHTGDYGPLAGSTGAPTNLSNVNSSVVTASQTNGYASYGIATASGICLFLPNATEAGVSGFGSVNLNPASYSDLSFSWYQGDGLNVDQRLAVQIGGNWYATANTFVNQINFASFDSNAVQKSFSFDPTAALWRDLTFTAGSSLTISGSNRILDLPSGAITNFGILGQSSASGTGNVRFDSFSVVGVPEPGIFSLVSLAAVGLLFGTRKRQE